MSDSTKTANIDLLDAGSYRWQLATRYNSTDDTHSISLVSTDWEHQMVHEGKGFTCSGKITGLGVGATSYLLARNLNGTPVHWRIANITVEDAPVDINFYENPTVNVAGTQQTTYNKNRASTATAALEVYEGPTIGAVGTGPLEFGYVPSVSGGGAGPGGGSAGSDAQRVGGEWILDTNEDYLVAITNNSGGAIDYGYYFFWYELD